MARGTNPPPHVGYQGGDAWFEEKEHCTFILTMHDPSGLALPTEKMSFPRCSPCLPYRFERPLEVLDIVAEDLAPKVSYSEVVSDARIEGVGGQTT